MERWMLSLVFALALALRAVPAAAHAAWADETRLPCEACHALQGRAPRKIPCPPDSAVGASGYPDSCPPFRALTPFGRAYEENHYMLPLPDGRVAPGGQAP